MTEKEIEELKSQMREVLAGTHPDTIQWVMAEMVLKMETPPSKTIDGGVRRPTRKDTKIRKTIFLV